MFGLWEPLMTEERREKTNGDEDVAGPRRMLNEKQVLEIVPVGRTALYRNGDRPVSEIDLHQPEPPGLVRGPNRRLGKGRR
jgi:hypothetical protein